jgi:hypothetical protein
VVDGAAERMRLQPTLRGLGADLIGERQLAQVIAGGDP